MQLKLKTNALSVNSNTIGATHGHLRLLITNTKYATLSNFLYEHPVQPDILQIPNSATCDAPYKLKRVYDKDL